MSRWHASNKTKTLLIVRLCELTPHKGEGGIPASSREAIMSVISGRTSADSVPAGPLHWAGLLGWGACGVERPWKLPSLLRHPINTHVHDGVGRCKGVFFKMRCQDGQVTCLDVPRQRYLRYCKANGDIFLTLASQARRTCLPSHKVS